MVDCVKITMTNFVLSGIWIHEHNTKGFVHFEKEMLMFEDHNLFNGNESYKREYHEILFKKGIIKVYLSEDISDQNRSLRLLSYIRSSKTHAMINIGSDVLCFIERQFAAPIYRKSKKVQLFIFSI